MEHFTPIQIREPESTYCLSVANNREKMKNWRASLCAFGGFAVLLPPKVPERRQEWIPPRGLRPWLE